MPCAHQFDCVHETNAFLSICAPPTSPDQVNDLGWVEALYKREWINRVAHVLHPKMPLAHTVTLVPIAHTHTSTESEISSRLKKRLANISPRSICCRRRPSQTIALVGLLWDTHKSGGAILTNAMVSSLNKLLALYPLECAIAHLCIMYGVIVNSTSTCPEGIWQ